MRCAPVSFSVIRAAVSAAGAVSRRFCQASASIGRIACWLTLAIEAEQAEVLGGQRGSPQ